MAIAASETISRPDNLTNDKDPAVLYALSYLLTRAIIGFLGIFLPISFIIGEFFLAGNAEVKGSLSAYYHTSMRDLFVAGLCVTGFFLATYLAGERKTWDFWLSLVAGIAVLFVAFLPTSRPHLAPGAPRCGVLPMPEGCAAVQQRFGEVVVARVHFFSAAVFILSLAALCFVFAKREKEHKHAPGMAKTIYGCGIVIIAAVVWAIIGGLLNVHTKPLTPLYMAEVASVWAFGLAWILKARDLFKALVGMQPAPDATPDRESVKEAHLASD
jgi:MFS family permease